MDISWKTVGIIAIIGFSFMFVIIYATIQANTYTPEEYVGNVSIGNSSDGLWNINLTGIHLLIWIILV